MAQRTDYKDFNEQDFMNDPYFQDWVNSPDDEQNEFWQHFLTTHPGKKESIEKAKAFLQALAFRESWPPAGQVEHALNEALAAIEQKEHARSSEVPVRSIPIYRKWWAAAAAILMLAIAGYFLLNNRTDEGASIAEKIPPPQPEIVPGSDKALLTLADGTRVALDSAQKGAVTKEGNVTIVNRNGQLKYNREGSTEANEIFYNTVTTPRGGQYQLVLADGTKVWLNAASSLRFPTAFPGKERLVELTGEGYFEVAHDAGKPFIVKKGESQIRVLGTHFNINAYEDEPWMKVTLLEGRVMVTKNENKIYLSEGQQAKLKPGLNDIDLVNNVDVEEVVAWKNGRFLFNSARIETILRQAARWYNVDVVYVGKTDETFSGAMPRSDNISELLKILEATGKVHFTIEGTQIVVKPKL